jgi:hypothetical protein
MCVCVSIRIYEAVAILRLCCKLAKYLLRCHSLLFDGLDHALDCGHYQPSMLWVLLVMLYAVTFANVSYHIVFRKVWVNDLTIVFTPNVNVHLCCTP